MIYLDTDAVMFDQLLIDLPKDVKPPCIASATEYAGMHNAGFYCIYPTMLSEVKDEVMILSLEDLWSAVADDEDTARRCRMDSDQVKELIRGNSGTYTLEQHQQQMISWVWRGTGVDELRIHSIREALIIWVHVFGLFGNPHFLLKISTPRYVES